MKGGVTVKKAEAQKLVYDLSKLVGRIRDKFGKQEAFAHALGTSERSLSLKLNGERYFKPDEISRSIELLDLTLADIPEYFFTVKVQDSKLSSGV
jgi:hypothetical protein